MNRSRFYNTNEHNVYDIQSITDFDTKLRLLVAYSYVFVLVLLTSFNFNILL